MGLTASLIERARRADPFGRATRAANDRQQDDAQPAASDPTAPAHQRLVTCQLDERGMYTSR